MQIAELAINWHDKDLLQVANNRAIEEVQLENFGLDQSILVSGQLSLEQAFPLEQVLLLRGLWQVRAQPDCVELLGPGRPFFTV